MIDVKNVTKFYGGKKNALKDVSMFFGRGITFLIGENGAGKSTLLRLCAAIDFPSDGKILSSGEDGVFFDSQKRADLVKKNTGFVPDSNILPKRLSVRELLQDFLSLYEVPKENRSIFFEKTVADCLLDEVLDIKIHELSKGSLQRVMLSAAMIHRPENLILDEAMNALDPSKLMHFRKIIKEYSKEHTVVVSTHIMQEISALSGKIYVLSKGIVSASGSEEEILLKTQSNTLEESLMKLNEKPFINGCGGGI